MMPSPLSRMAIVASPMLALPSQANASMIQSAHAMESSCEEPSLEHSRRSTSLTGYLQAFLDYAEQQRARGRVGGQSAEQLRLDFEGALSRLDDEFLEILGDQMERTGAHDGELPEVPDEATRKLSDADSEGIYKLLHQTLRHKATAHVALCHEALSGKGKMKKVNLDDARQHRSQAASSK